jgi:hypothetical protein
MQLIPQIQLLISLMYVERERGTGNRGREFTDNTRIGGRVRIVRRGGRREEREERINKTKRSKRTQEPATFSSAQVTTPRQTGAVARSRGLPLRPTLLR